MSLPFHVKGNAVGPKADFQFWSVLWSGSTQSFPNPIFYVPRHYYRRKFWCGAYFAGQASQLTNSAISFDFVFAHANPAMHPDRKFPMHWGDDYPSNGSTQYGWRREGVNLGIPIKPSSTLGPVLQHEPIQFRNAPSPGVTVFSAAPNYFEGEYDYVQLRPTVPNWPSGRNSPFHDAVGTNNLTVFCACYSEQPIEPR